MIPFLIMIGVVLVARAAGALGLEPLDSWCVATRVGLAAMFFVTGIAHFNKMRADLIRMVPPQLPNPAALVPMHGVAELLGAIGLLVPAVSRWAALGLALLLVAMFPANIYSARSGQTLRGRPATRLAVRTPLQVIWIALLLWVAF